MTIAPDRNSRRGDAAPNAASVAEESTSTPDQIDDQFIEFRNAARTDFHTFANELGYLGKQMYIAVNFGETLVASAVFNGTDMLRGEGVLKNLGEMTYDAFLAGLYIVVDNLYLAIPGLPPIVTLPDRGPVDSPPEWRRPLPPQPGRPLVVPFPNGPEASDALVDDAAAVTDDESVAEKDSGTEAVAADVPDEAGDSDVPPAGDDSEGAEGADEQEDLQEEQAEAEESDAEESEESEESEAEEQEAEESASTAPQDSESDDEGATDATDE
ncbi:hypothetical protein [Mycolicibacterium pyrenivorans]|uniref:hypothetical protein n=1 Tax=Mycolicibacterium pyrenivorans TaxID=187102 RepID=UPI0021F3755A|nr:hypothetical protein [Mycolicibacterium pyrenivorans]MCV7151570.1 hypothetical protein [Mycolicibacterium pyrenivorans]